MKTVDIKNIDILDELSYGSFGRVLKCFYDGKEYALKIFPNINFLNGKKAKLNTIEANVNNPGLITPLFWVTTKNKKVAYLTNVINGKNIEEIDTYETEEKIQILKKAKRAIISMQKEGIIHADISSSNIMFANNRIKIIDFDNCTYKNFKTNPAECRDLAQEFIKTYGIRPELDIFLFNLLTFELINNISEENVRAQILGGNLSFFEGVGSRKICSHFFLCQKYPTKDFLIDTIDEKSFKA